MQRKLILPQAFKSLLLIFNAKKDINCITQFEFNDRGIELCCMDPYHTTQLICQIKAQTPNNIPSFVCATSISLEEEHLRTLNQLLKTHTTPLVIQFGSNTDIQFLDANKGILFLALPHCVDTCLQRFPTQLDEKCIIKYLAHDFVTTLLNLCVASAIIEIWLNIDSTLHFHASCDVGSIHVSKQLQDTPISQPHKLQLIIKHVKTLSMLLERVTHFNLHFPLPDQTDQSLNMSFRLDSFTSGVFSLPPFVF